MAQNIRDDPQLFTGRELSFANGCASPATVTAAGTASNWAANPSGSSYTNWQAAGSVWRYGVQVFVSAVY